MLFKILFYLTPCWALGMQEKPSLLRDTKDPCTRDVCTNGWNTEPTLVFISLCLS